MLGNAAIRCKGIGQGLKRELNHAVASRLVAVRQLALTLRIFLHGLRKRDYSPIASAS